MIYKVRGRDVVTGKPRSAVVKAEGNIQAEEHACLQGIVPLSVSAVRQGEPGSLSIAPTFIPQAFAQIITHPWIKRALALGKSKEEVIAEVRNQAAEVEKQALREGIVDKFGINYPCSRCGEKLWQLESTSPNLKSVIWCCGYCKKKELVQVEAPMDKPGESGRKGIAKNVQREVWRRDQGRCVHCGSNERLEFDHIIPVIKGGSDTARNLQLLCEQCNRTKSDDIG